MSTPRYETFGGRIGDTFTIQDPTDGGAPVEVTLVEVNDHTGSESGPRLAFSVTFEGPSERAVPQGTYEFGDGADRFVLFIVPIGQVEDRVQYEAVFTQLSTP